MLVETWGFNDDKRIRKVIEMKNKTEINDFQYFMNWVEKYKEELKKNPIKKINGGGLK